MKTLDIILNYLFFMGISFIGGMLFGAAERPQVLEKIWDYCIAK